MRYGLAFILIFAALLTVVIGGIPSTAQQPTVVPPFLQTPSVSPAPVIVDTVPTATPAAPGCDNPLPLEPGSGITLRPGVNIRYSPSINSPWLANFEENKIFTIMDGPVCGDNYLWWQVSGNGVTGWVAERNKGISFIRFYEPGPNAPIDCRTPLVLTAGQEVEVAAAVRVRNEPSLEGRVITVAPYESIVTILDSEPTCADGFNWWNIRVTVVNFEYTGWMVVASGASSDFEVNYIEVTPAPDCSQPMLASAGDRGRIRYTDRIPKNMRTAPGLDSDILFTLVEGVPFEIVSGSVCEDGLNWWQIKVLASSQPVGWFAEGSRPNYWLRITNDIGADRALTSTVLPTSIMPVSITPAGGATATPVPTLTPTPTP